MSRLIVVPRVRPVRLMPRTGLGLRGEIEVAKFGRDGQRVPVRVDRSKRAFQNVWDHRQANLITNAGMDYGFNETNTFLRFLNIILYVAVGTGSGAPQFTDTALDAEVARTNATLDLGTNGEVLLPSEGVGRFRRVRAFDFGEANGNLTEFGGAAGTVVGAPTILTRNLFLDEFDNPTTITKTADEQLRIIYDLFVEVDGPTALTPTSDLVFTGFGNVEASWMQYARASGSDGSPAAAGWPNGPWQFRPAWAAVTFFPTTYATVSLGASFAAGGRGVGEFEAYVGGSYERTVTGAWTTTAEDADALGIILGDRTGSAPNFGVTPYWGWRFTDPDPFTKEFDYRLIMSATVSVTRT